MKRLFSGSLFLGLMAGAVWILPASAQQPDCIENIRGEIVCGAAAEAVRARIRAEGAAARGQDPRQPGMRTGSVYGGFGQSVFLRGGYIFAGHAGGVSDNASAPMGALGMRFPISKNGRSHWSFELEGVYARDSEDLVGGLTLSGWGITGIAAIRWEYATDIGVNPFISGGAGPAYYQLKLDDGVTVVNDGEWGFGYTGRAGLAAHVSDGMSLEAGYRYLGVTQNGSAGSHTAELGLNIHF